MQLRLVMAVPVMQVWIVRMRVNERRMLVAMRVPFALTGVYPSGNWRSPHNRIFII